MYVKPTLLPLPADYTPVQPVRAASSTWKIWRITASDGTKCLWLQEEGTSAVQTVGRVSNLPGVKGLICVMNQITQNLRISQSVWTLVCSVRNVARSYAHLKAWRITCALTQVTVHLSARIVAEGSWSAVVGGNTWKYTQGRSRTNARCVERPL